MRPVWFLGQVGSECGDGHLRQAEPKPHPQPINGPCPSWALSPHDLAYYLRPPERMCCSLGALYSLGSSGAPCQRASWHSGSTLQGEC